MNTLNKILELKRSRIEEIRKKKDKKIIGWICAYVPEEIIHAAGFTPYRVFKGGEDEPVATAEAYFQRNLCPFAMATLGYALLRNYDFLEGLVCVSTCDALRRLHEIWKTYAKGPPFIFQLDLPRVYMTKGAFDYFKKELLRFKHALEDLIANEITNERLIDSIKVYNRTRLLLREIYKLRKSKKPPISGAEMLEVVWAGMILDRDIYNSLLAILINELKEREAHQKFGPRILITGSIMADGDKKVIGLIEDLGGTVVCDDLCTGTRYFWNLVEDSDDLDDPIDVICRHYLNKVPCPRMMPSAMKRLEFVLDLIKEFRVNGVVYYTLKFCDTFQYDFPLFKKEIENRGIPVLGIDTEYSVSDTGQLRTRIEAFIEMLKKSIQIQ